MPAPQSITVALDDLTIRGLKTPGDGSLKALCLHGWLDNANSFIPLIPLLPNVECVAIDLPGHGKSGHLHHTVPYTIASTTHYALRVADALGWENFHIIGHSLGGNIAVVCAATAPEKVAGLCLIDAMGPVSEPADALPQRLQRYHREMIMRVQSKPRTLEDIEQAVATRLHATKMTKEAARLIVERQLSKCDNGYQWGFDPKLRAASPSYFTEEQVLSILSSITCPTLGIVASDGYLVNSTKLETRARSIELLKSVELAGNHHLHMDSPSAVAEAINQFLAD